MRAPQNRAARRTCRTAIASALVLALASPAGAAPACRLVTDRGGDQITAKTDPRYGEVDVLSADVATDSKSLTAVVRLASLGAVRRDDPRSGRMYEFDFTVNETTFMMLGSLMYGGEDWGVWTRPTKRYPEAKGGGGFYFVGEATGVVDPARGEVRITAPLSVFSRLAPIRHGTRLYALSAFSYTAEGFNVRYPTPVEGRDVGAVVVGYSDADDAWGRMETSYRAGSASCVRVGR